MLHYDAIEPHTFELLKRLQRLPTLADTRLAGGTALALQLGHRLSVDLDIFGRWDFSVDMTSLLGQIGIVEKQSGTPDGRMQFFFVDDVKVDCIAYEMYEWLEPPVEENGVRLAGIKDIGAMKINAITNRGTRKDFVDVARLLDEFTLEDIFGWYQEKYPQANPALALRSLSYFVDAEAMPMPQMLICFDWDAAVEKIQASVRNLVCRDLG